MTVPKNEIGGKKKFQRLPGNVIPHNYDVHLKLDPEKLDFVGEQKIHIDVVNSTDTVVLNASDLNISSVTYKDGSGNELKSQSTEVQQEEETLTIIFPEKLPVGKLGYLAMVFDGKINQDRSEGLFISKNTSPNSKVKQNIFTKFEPTYARRCIPCWDEPAFKATFDVTVTVPQHLTALSNMPAKAPKAMDETTHTVSFERSPIMSTYLLAIAVGEFDYVEDYSSDGVLVRVYTGKGRQETGRFSLDVAVKVLPFYKKYFDIPYPLPKLDFVALENFSSAGMENWGLITCKDTCLLFDPDNTSTDAKQFVAAVVTHEVAHMWFGNLVTMEWFTYLWLNEGYAVFMENYSVNHIFPHYNIWTQFITGSYLVALELDSLKNTHAIEVPVGHPSEIKEIFDVISYNKGSSVLRMLHAYIGDENFRKGMHAYLAKHSYANTRTEDLWVALEEASQKPVEKVMTAWIKQEGFPLVTIEELDSSNPDSGKRIFKLTQNRFMADGSSDPKGTVWHIPVKIICGVEPHRIIYDDIFSDREKIIELENVPQDTWIKINPGLIGFFRTMYSKVMFDRLGQGILTKSLDSSDRLGIFDDLQALSRAGCVKVDQVLRLSLAFKDEGEYTVWRSIISCLSRIDILTSHLEIRKELRTFSKYLLQDIYKKLGWEAKPGEEHLNKMLRPLVIEKLVALEDSDVLREAKKKFEAQMSKEAPIPVDLREAVYRAVMSQDTGDLFNKIMSMYRECNLNDEKNRLICSLGYSKDPEKIKELLRFSLSDEASGNSDPITVVGSATRSYQGRLIVWEFFKENISTYLKRCSGVFILPAVVKRVTSNFVEESKAQEIEEFFQANPIPAADRALQQSLENIRLNAACLKNNIDNIASFLRNEEMPWNRS